MNSFITRMKSFLSKNFIFLLSLILFIISVLTKNYYVAFISVIILYTYLVIYSLKDWKNNLLLLAFLGSLFLFLLGNPTLTILTGQSFKKIYTESNINFAFYCIYSSLLGLYLYNYIHDLKLISYQNKNDLFRFHFDITFIKKIVIIPMLILSGISFFIIGIEEIVFILNHSYTDFYTLFSSQLPTIVRMFIQFWLISVCFYLATKPDLRNVIIVLSVNLILNIPSFIVGMRSPLMINLVFTILYIILRFIQANKRFNKKLIIIGICTIPLLMSGLSIYGNLRNGSNNSNTFEESLSKFVIDQGHMFDIIADSKDLLDELPQNEVINYIIGPVYDTIINNPITRTLFKVPNIGNQNEDSLKYSHNMKIQLSYLFYGDKFFEGFGVGTSYILESYTTLGYIGIIIWSMVIALYCKYAIWSLKYESKFVFNGILLLIFAQFLYTPRANALLPFVQINHILAFIVILYITQIIRNKYLERRGKFQ